MVNWILVCFYLKIHIFRGPGVQNQFFGRQFAKNDFFWKISSVSVYLHDGPSKKNRPPKSEIFDLYSPLLSVGGKTTSEMSEKGQFLDMFPKKIKEDNNTQQKKISKIKSKNEI